jgi:hypothetical protein
MQFPVSLGNHKASKKVSLTCTSQSPQNPHGSQKAADDCPQHPQAAQASLLQPTLDHRGHPRLHPQELKIDPGAAASAGS